jgi:outer membrane protein assembly factor BamD
MRRSRPTCLLILVFLFAFPHVCPAPLIYRPGEGWVYETPGEEGKWTRARAQEQLEVAEEAFNEGNYGLAIKASRRVVKVWPLSDHAPRAQYLLARSYEDKGNLERAFNAYQVLLEQYPKFGNAQEVLERQFNIANQYLAGKWFRLWGTIPFYRSMERTVAMYEKIVRNGPFSPVAPHAQMNIGAARENQRNFFNRIDPFREAVGAYEKAVDRYHDNRAVASEALFKAGMAYYRQARKADYDQSVAQQAYATFSDFIVLYPNHAQVPEAQERMTELRTEQARGFWLTARYYDRRRETTAAMIYYNETYVQDPNGPFATRARERLAELRTQAGMPLTAAAPAGTSP